MRRQALISTLYLWVKVNGKVVGEHRGYLTPYEIDISAFVGVDERVDGTGTEQIEVGLMRRILLEPKISSRTSDSVFSKRNVDTICRPLITPTYENVIPRQG